MKQLLFYLLILGAMGCKQQYDPPVHAPETGYLVVDGFINSGQDAVTTIKLSRTTPLSDRDLKAEKGAQLQIEAQDNSIYNLVEADSGNYISSNLNLNNGSSYRVNITTSDGKQYQSDFVAAKNNPPIDSISWRRENDGVQIYINTHDDLDTTLYYQWEYKETWEFHSSFQSLVKYEIITPPSGPQLYGAAYRNGNPPVYSVCWQNEQSSDILLGSTVKLEKDVVNLPLAFIEPKSWKLSVLFSIDVKQYVLSKNGYEFLQRMKKNTESVGSIFDSQPSELNGNFHCVSDPAEIVVGFLNISPLREQRIYIANSQVPGWGYNPGCFQIEIVNDPDSIRKYGIGLMPTTVAKGGLVILSFFAADGFCVDCEIRGTHIKPSFWP